MENILGAITVLIIVLISWIIIIVTKSRKKKKALSFNLEDLEKEMELYEMAKNRLQSRKELRVSAGFCFYISCWSSAPTLYALKPRLPYDNAWWFYKYDYVSRERLLEKAMNDLRKRIEYGKRIRNIS
jgi:hypothetical protein